MDAIVTTFFFPGGKHYGKKVIPEMLVDIEPLLYCRVQHVVSAVGEQIDLYVDEAEENVLKIIRARIQDQPDTVQYKQYAGHLMSAEPSNAQGGAGKNSSKYGMNLVEDPTYFAFKKRVNHEFPLI